VDKKREMPLAGEDQQYAKIVALLGQGRVRARFSDGAERQGSIRGRMKKREWVRQGDVVLVSDRVGLAGEAFDVVFRYQPAEVQRLHQMNQAVGLGAEEDDPVDEAIVFEDSDAYATDFVRVVPGLPPLVDDYDVDIDGI
jgi:translation initiation factor 1A